MLCTSCWRGKETWSWIEERTKQNKTKKRVPTENPSVSSFPPTPSCNVILFKLNLFWFPISNKKKKSNQIGFHSYDRSSLEPLDHCLAETHLHYKRQLSSVEGQPAPGNVTWSSTPAAPDMWKQRGTSGTLAVLLTLAVPPKGTVTGTARKEFLQLHSLNRLSPYLSPCSLTTAKHMPQQPQRPAIVILSVLSFPTGFSCLTWLVRHAAACQPLGQSCSNCATATQHTQARACLWKKGVAQICSLLAAVTFLDATPHLCVQTNMKDS